MLNKMVFRKEQVQELLTLDLLIQKNMEMLQF